MSILKVSIVVLFVLSLLLNVYLLLWDTPAQAGEGSLVQETEKYPYLSKRVLMEFPNDILINFRPLRSELRETVGPYGDTFGFYFEYLPTGTSIGVNEKAEFESASLFKVPIAMAYYRVKERKGIKEDTIATIQASHIDKEYGTLWKKGVGAKISLDKAVDLALTESDNTAIQVVSAYIEHDDLLDVYEGVDIDLKTSNQHAVVTTKGFSSVLKSLFFASVLSKENSEKVLEMMTRSVFMQALRAGVPKSVPVAHKVGFLNENLYMDCGIVYVPRRPYVLCMVSSSTGEEADRRMKDVSKRVYDYVKNVSPEW